MRSIPRLIRGSGNERRTRVGAIIAIFALCLQFLVPIAHSFDFSSHGACGKTAVHSEHSAGVSVGDPGEPCHDPDHCGICQTTQGGRPVLLPDAPSAISRATLCLGTIDAATSLAHVIGTPFDSGPRGPPSGC